MARKSRVDIENTIYHIVHRANARIQIFQTQTDYLLFEKTLGEAMRKFKIRLFSLEIMPNHIHLALSPKIDGEVARFMHWLAMTFTQRYHKLHNSAGTGHLFQGRYKSFIVKGEKYLLRLFMYIEKNALTATIVERAENWRWGSLWIRLNGTKNQKNLLDDWPIKIPKDYLETINSNLKIAPEKMWAKLLKIGRPKKEEKKGS